MTYGPSTDRTGSGPACDISIVVPTRNEANNVEPLIRAIERALTGHRVEVLFVDDSDDDTPKVVEQVAKRSRVSIRLIHRAVEDRGDGLGGAVVTGFRSARAPWICVMDGDLQHPPEVIDRLLTHAEEHALDVVLASRFHGSKRTEGLGRLRNMASHALIGASRVLFPNRLKGVTDPLTGFFLVRRSALDLRELRPNGFKILLEILIRTPELRVGEIGFMFGQRHAGESKASTKELTRYLGLLWRLRFGDMHKRFGKFGLVGITGLFVNTAALWFLVSQLGMSGLAGVLAATAVSSVWNFSLIELWAYHGQRHERSLPTRFGAFTAMNYAALLLRGPLMFILISWVGFHYLVANILSLCAMTVIRFALADNWIWASLETGMKYRYNIHDLVSVESPVRLPELARFRTEQLDGPAKISVAIDRMGDVPSGPAHVDDDGIDVVTYRERLGSFAFGVRYRFDPGQVKVTASPLLRRSPHVLYTNCVEPLIRWTFAEMGFALVHAACVSSGDRAYLITARTDTGKTTTILKTLDNHSGYGFISDDLTLVHPDGRVLTYPKPLTISQHTLHAVKTPNLTNKQRVGLKLQARLHSRGGRSIGMALAEKGLPAATMNAVIQMLIPPPKYDVTKLIPGVDVVSNARLAGMFIIERGGEGETRLSQAEAIDTLMENCDDAYGFPPYPVIQKYLHSRNGADLKGDERDIATSAMDGLPTMLLKSTTMDWWRRLPVMMGDRKDSTEPAEHEVGGGVTALAPAFEGRV